MPHKPSPLCLSMLGGGSNPGGGRRGKGRIDRTTEAKAGCGSSFSDRGARRLSRTVFFSHPRRRRREPGENGRSIAWDRQLKTIFPGAAEACVHRSRSGRLQTGRAQPRANERHDPADENSRLAGASCRLDKERGAEIGENTTPCLLCCDHCTRFWHLFFWPRFISRKRFYL